MTAHTDSGATRASLLSRAKQQDAAAWRELVSLYGPLVAHWCHRCGLDSHTAADCVQDVFTSVAKSLNGFRAEGSSGSFRGWLWTITSNKIKDMVRRSRNQPSAPGGSTALHFLQNLPQDLDVPDVEPSEPQQLSDLVGRGLEQVRGEFEPRTWDIFRRCVIDQISTAIVAEEFCVTAAAVRQVRSRVLRRLRQQLGDLEL